MSGGLIINYKEKQPELAVKVTQMKINWI